MTTTEAIKQLQTEHDLIAGERDLDGSQFAPALLEALAMAIDMMSDKDTNVPSKDCIDRAEAQKAIQFAARRYTVAHEAHGEGHVVWSDNLVSVTDAMNALRGVPSAQPERTCVNCGRTVNNGGWYADGRTRCPIEEHYALPKDGFCHLWEKRNVTDDDYPERREE